MTSGHIKNWKWLLKIHNYNNCYKWLTMKLWTPMTKDNKGWEMWKDFTNTSSLSLAVISISFNNCMEWQKESIAHGELPIMTIYALIKFTKQLKCSQWWHIPICAVHINCLSLNKWTEWLHLLRLFSQSLRVFFLLRLIHPDAEHIIACRAVI